MQSQRERPTQAPVPAQKYRLRKNQDRRPIVDHQQHGTLPTQQDDALGVHDQEQEKTDQVELRRGPGDLQGQNPRRATSSTAEMQTNQNANIAQQPYHQPQPSQHHDPATRLLEAEQACNARLRTRNRVLTGTWQAEQMHSKRTLREKDAVIREMQARADRYGRGGVAMVVVVMLLTSATSYLLWCWLNAAEFEYLRSARRREWGLVERREL